MQLLLTLKICSILTIVSLVSSCALYEHTNTTESKPLLTALVEKSKAFNEASAQNSSTRQNLVKLKKPEPPKKTTPTKPTKTYSSSNTVIRNVRTTAYCHLENEPGAYGNLNAIGTPLRYWGGVRSAAADWSKYPLGTQFKIVGEPHIYEIDDFGSALVGNGTVDFYKPTLEAMNAWGLRYIDIEIVKWGSYSKSLSYLSGSSGYWHVRQMYYNIKPKVDRYKTYSYTSPSTKPKDAANPKKLFFNKEKSQSSRPIRPSR